MSRRPATFKLSDMTRAVKGIVAAGVSPERFTSLKVTREAATIYFGATKDDPDGESENVWDEVLNK